MKLSEQDLEDIEKVALEGVEKFAKGETLSVSYERKGRKTKCIISSEHVKLTGMAKLRHDEEFSDKGKIIALIRATQR